MNSAASRLSNLTLSHVYRQRENNIAKEFYLPCFEIAERYDRAVGFFSSSIYVLAWPSLRAFIENQGKIRLICSHVLSGKDAEAFEEGYGAIDKDESLKSLRGEIRRLLDDPYLNKPTRVLATLVALGRLEFKVAFVGPKADPRSRKLFHDKVGIFSDRSGGSVVFKGSMNETWAALSPDGNIESVDVYVSWGGERDALRVEDETRYFNTLWNNKYPDVDVRDFPQVAREELLNSADPSNWEHLVREICSEIELAAELSPDRGPRARTPLRHQVLALDNWTKNGRRGILKHATGSGKTFTALCAMNEAISRGEVPVILVPSAILMDQWEREVRQTFQSRGVQVLTCDARSPEWRASLGPWTRPGSDARVVIASMATATTEDFLNRLRQGQHLFLVADEVHALGSSGRRNILGAEFGSRLGLSATPERAGDPEGTAAVFAYFGGTVPPEYTLRDAINDHILVPYSYKVHRVALTTEEQEEWNTLTTRIQQLYAQNMAIGGDSAISSIRMRQLQLRRARIVKNATRKVGLARDVLLRHYRPGQRWLVYCDTQEQLNEVLFTVRAANIPAAEYHSSMLSDRSAVIAYLEAIGGVVVSIKCLDEGVDIPAVDHALILASSRNPREFIQRRGRVLRRSDNKTLAVIHDAIVVPNLENGTDVSDRMTFGELARAIQFGKDAINPACVTEIERIGKRSWPKCTIINRCWSGGFR